MKKLYIIVALLLVSSGIFAQLNESFEGTTFPPTGWKMVDQDGDGNNWFQYSVTTGNIAHTGTYTAASASWYNQVVLTPTNYLITPSLIVSSTTDSIAYWMAPQDKKYPGEHYEVKVSTTGTNPADFTTTLYSYTFTFADTLVDWHRKALSLSAFANDTVYVAFVHTSCTDMFYLKLDDVTGPATYIPAIPDLTVQSLISPQSGSGLTNAETVKVLLKNVGYGSATGYTVSYQKGVSTPVSQIGNTSIAIGDTMTFTFTTPVDLSAYGDDSIRVWVSLAADIENSNDTLGYTVISNIAPATLPYSMGFETTENLDGWILRNLNGGGTWGLGSTAALAHSGAKYALFNYDASLPGDDWLISNGITMTGGQTINLSFYYRARPGYAEKMNVYFMSSNAINDTLVKLVDYSNITDTVYQRSLSSFTVPSNGVYFIGFHAYSDPDMWQLLVDDIEIGQNVSVKEVLTEETFRVYPNPVKNELNINSSSSLKNVKIINAVGQEVMNVKVSGNSYRVNTSSYKNGIYFVQIESEKGLSVKKFVVSE